MKKILFTIMILALLAFLGCSKTQTINQDVPKTNSVPSEPAAPIAVPSTQEVQVTAPVPKPIPTTQTEATQPNSNQNAECQVAPGAMDLLKTTMENKDESVQTTIGVNSYLDVKIGDCVIFPFAVRNEFSENKNFLIEVDFLEAKDRMSVPNTMAAERPVMLKWITETDLSEKTVEPQKYIIFPVKVRIEDMRTSKEKTVPGTYKFDIQAYYKTGLDSKSRVGAHKEIFVRIKE